MAVLCLYTHLHTCTLARIHSNFTLVCVSFSNRVCCLCICIWSFNVYVTYTKCWAVMSQSEALSNCKNTIIIIILRDSLEYTHLNSLKLTVIKQHNAFCTHLDTFNNIQTRLTPEQSLWTNIHTYTLNSTLHLTPIKQNHREFFRTDFLAIPGLQWWLNVNYPHPSCTDHRREPI